MGRAGTSSWMPYSGGDAGIGSAGRRRKGHGVQGGCMHTGRAIKSPIENGGETRTFAAVLVRQAEGARKGVRTRSRIAAAACQALDGQSLGDVTVGGICQMAGVAHGTFYIYFPDRDGLISDVLAQFVDFVQTAMHRAARQSPDDPARASTEAYYDLFEQNPGLMKILVNHLDGFPAARQQFQTLNRQWLETVAQATARRLMRLGKSLPEAELLRRAYALGGMTDQYLTGLILSRDPSMIAISGDRAAVIDTLNLIWQRGMEP